jgi:hypothetical protein
MKEYFVNYNQALALKELGFDEPCWCYFVNDVFFDSMFPKDYDYFEHMNKKMEYTLAPLKSQVFKWFRNDHKLESNIIFHECYYEHGDKNVYEVNIESSVDYNVQLHITPIEGFKNYEEAESVCIDNLIELIKNK